MSDAYREIMVKRIPQMKDYVIKGLMIFAAALLTAAGVLFFPPLLLGTLIMIAVCYFVFPGFDLEYEYLYVNGELDIDKIMSKKKRKACAGYNMENLEMLAPTGSHALDEYQKNKSITRKDFTSMNPEVPSYTMVIMKEKGLEMVKLELDEAVLGDIRRIAPRKVSMI
ncbi:MAG: DUF6106 family protein [Lachnospiraceae bacterium]|nr:DUF6106 family protein [Lachnospiraceae bacterium]